MRQRGGGRIENEQTAVTIQEDLLSVPEFLGHVVQSDHRRQPERTGHDGGVGSAAAQIGRQAEHEFAVHRRGIRWRDVVRHQDMGLGQRQKRLRRLPLKVSNNPARHVLDVDGALTQVGIVDLAQGIGIMVRHLLKDEFHIAQIRLELAQDFIDQRSIFDHEQVCVENTGILGPDRFRDPLLHFKNLGPRLDQRGFESPDFVRDFTGLDATPRDFIAVVANDMDRSQGEAGRDPDALEPRLRHSVIATHVHRE